MKKFIRVLLIIIVALGIAGTIFFNKLTAGKDYTPDVAIKNTDMLDNLKNVELKKGVVTVPVSDVNEMLKVYFQEQKNVGGIRIKALKLQSVNDKVNITVPFNYKGMDLLLTSQGDVSVKGDKIAYSMEDLKVGKVSMPKDYILNRIKQSNIKNVTVEGNEILMDSQIAHPLKIKSIKLDNDKFIIKVL